MVDTEDLKSSGRNTVRVRVPSTAPHNTVMELADKARINLWQRMRKGSSPFGIAVVRATIKSPLSPERPHFIGSVG